MLPVSPGYPAWPHSELCMVMYPPHPRNTINALDIETSYYSAGDRQNERIVLLHGMSTSGDSYREIMHELAGEYYLVAPDLPGFGYSADTAPYTLPHLVEWLAAFVDALELRPAHVVGHSFGGVVATGYSLSYPEDVFGQVLLAPALLVPQDFPDWMLGLTRYDFSQSMMEAGISASRLMMQRQIRAPFYDPERLDPSLWERREGDYARSRASGAAMRAVARNELIAELPRLHRPNCLIWGAEDPVLDPAGARLLAERLPHAEYHLLPECGHAPQLEQTEQTVQIVRRFLPQTVYSRY